uniref:Uncharacterized protein n=1 Tax=Salix viminalis TaxID=40686 RepID=A0A6N2K138_SALVM
MLLDKHPHFLITLQQFDSQMYMSAAHKPEHKSQKWPILFHEVSWYIKLFTVANHIVGCGFHPSCSNHDQHQNHHKVDHLEDNLDHQLHSRYPLHSHVEVHQAYHLSHMVELAPVEDMAHYHNHRYLDHYD